MKIEPDDPILTSYALGELDEAEREAIEAQLEESPEARRSVEEILQTADLLTREMSNERFAPMTTSQRELIEKAAELAPTKLVRVPFWRRPVIAWSFGAAAACLALALFLLPQTVRKSRTDLITQFSSRAPESERMPAQSILQTLKQNSGSPVPPHAVTYPGGLPGNTASAAPATVEPALAKRYGLMSPASAPAAGPPISRSALVAEQGNIEAPLARTVSDAQPSQPDSFMDPVLMRRYRPVRPRVQPPAQPDANSIQEVRDGAGAVLVAGESNPNVVTPGSLSRYRGMSPEMGRYGLRLPPQLANNDGTAERLRELQRDPTRADWLYKEWTPRDNTTAAYLPYAENPFRSVVEQPLSTFSIDVDTASYANVRRFLNQGQWPPRDAVRIEELINYFTYDYPQPGSEHPFSVNIEVAGCPWNAEHRLVRVGLKGREMAQDKRPPSNLVFLIDVSGSMAPPERLPLIKQALRQLVRKMTATDRVAIVVYASSSQTALASTSCSEKERIFAAIDKLTAGGSTNGGEGIQQAYALASENFIQGGVNRVLLCTDGDFNVGMTDHDQLIRLVKEQARSGVFLTTLGVGTDNYKDALMQKLADKGNGNYHYFDTLEEAQKVLVEQMNANLVTIAKDVKIQIEFNPVQVGSYRLIGYEKRALRNQDFNNDRKDAGEIGAGHTVTALYEILPANLKTLSSANPEPLKYQPGRAVGGVVFSPDGKVPTRETVPPPSAGPRRLWDARTGEPLNDGTATELLTLKLRYKRPDANESQLLEFSARDDGNGFSRASTDFKFAAAVAGFGLILKDSEFKGGSNLESVLEIARTAKGPDVGGYRADFINLVLKAKTLEPMPSSTLSDRDSDQRPGFE